MINFIEALPPEECQMCGAMAELRPYGPGGLYVCFDCGMKSPKTAETMLDMLHNLADDN